MKKEFVMKNFFKLLNLQKMNMENSKIGIIGYVEKIFLINIWEVL